MVIIISKNGKNAEKIDKSSFEQEDYLQRYIYDNPDSIPLYDIKEDIRLLILTREFPTNNGGYIDAVGIDKEGQIYIIETKLYKNPDKRNVVAQVLDYGASLWKNNNFEDFVIKINSFLNKKLNTNLNQRIKEFFKIEEEEVESITQNIASNLREGNLKFVVLMDHLHPGLKDLILFINKNSKFSIFAVELEYYKYKDYEIMIPKLIGAEIKKDVSTARIKGTWDEQHFFDDLTKNKLKEDEVNSIRRLFDFSKANADRISWGTGKNVGSWSPIFSRIDETRSIFTVRSNGRLVLNLGWTIKSEKDKMYRAKYKKLIENDKTFSIHKNLKYPEFVPKEWCDKVDKFIEIITELIS